MTSIIKVNEIQDAGGNTILSSNGTGTFTSNLPSAVNTPAFSAYKSSTSSISNVTDTNIIFDTEIFDIGSCYNNSTGVFTVPSGQAGKYFFTTNVMFQDGAGNVSDMILYLYETISSVGTQHVVSRAESTSNGTLFTLFNLNYSYIRTLGVGDQLQIQAYQQTNNSSSINIGGGLRTIFSGYKIIE